MWLSLIRHFITVTTDLDGRADAPDDLDGIDDLDRIDYSEEPRCKSAQDKPSRDLTPLEPPNPSLY